MMIVGNKLPTKCASSTPITDQNIRQFEQTYRQKVLVTNVKMNSQYVEDCLSNYVKSIYNGNKYSESHNS